MKEKNKKKLRKNIIKSSIFILAFIFVLTLSSIKPSALGYGNNFLSNYYEPIVNVLDTDGQYYNLELFVDSIPFTNDLNFDSFVSSGTSIELNTEFTGNATTTSIFGVTPNYRINNVVSFNESFEIALFQLNYEYITLYDEFLINYYLGEPTDLIPCSLYFDSSVIDRVTITYNWTYSKQENGIVRDYTARFLEAHPDLSNPINMLPMNVIRDNDDYIEFMETYGNGQFIKLKKCEVIIAIEPIYSDDVYFSALQYSTLLNNYDNNNLLAWYNFDDTASIGDIGGGLLEAAEGIVQFEILPNFTILDAILIILAIPLLIWILKVAFGG